MFDIPFLVSESFSLRDYFFFLHPVLASEVFLEIALRSKSAGSFVPAESLSAGKAAWAVNRKVASLKASIKGRKYCLCPPNNQFLTELGC